MNSPYEIENSYLFRGIHLMEEVNSPNVLDTLQIPKSVSYTHLTLPTN